MSCLRTLIKYTVILLCLFVETGEIKSQDIQVRYLGIEKGLSNNSVTTIFQDHNGFMWFGTYDGLNRFDGYDCTVFRNVIGDSNSIYSNNINYISEDPRHNIWVAGQKEINIYNPLTSHFEIPAYFFADGSSRARLADNVINLQLTSSKKNMLAGTQHNGLFSFVNSGTKGQQIPITIKNKTVTDYYVTSLKADPVNGTVYALIQNLGLFIYDENKEILIKKYDVPRPSNCLLISKDGRIWVGDNSGMYLLNSGSNTFAPNALAVKTSVVNFNEDKKGNIWVATDGSGVWILPARATKAVPLASMYPEDKMLVNSNAITTIYNDNDERKWIGTLRGGMNILEVPKNPFKKIIYHSSDNDRSVENFILSFCEDKSQNVWVGTDGAGLRYWNRRENRFTNYVHDENNDNSISANFVTNIVKDGGDGLWIATWFGGINHYNISTHKFEHFNCFNPKTNSTNNNIWTLLRDSHRRLWASAVRNGGLYLFNSALNRFIMFDSRLTDLQCLAEDAGGTIWAGDYSNLVKLDTINKKHTLYHIGYAIRSIYEDKQKNFWIGTQEGGLLLFNRKDGSYQRFTTSNGLPHNTVLRILEDESGNLWLSTYAGLSKFNYTNKTFKNYTQSDGLQSNQFSFNAALTLETGELLFGGIKGFNIFYPESISTRQSAPPVFLSQLKINNAPVQDHLSYVQQKDLETIKKVEVPFNQASFALDFLGLDYSEAATLSYAYYLQGWDKTWNAVKNTRSAIYSRLREGDYIFSVKVKQAGGQWGKPQELLHITVLPPWYRTWWAYFIYAVLACGAVYLYVLYKNNQAKLKFEVRLAHLQTKQEKELNEKKFAFFTNVSHEFRAPLSLIINPIKDLLRKANESADKPELNVVYKNAQRLLRLVDQLLLFKQAADTEDNLTLTKMDLVAMSQDVFDCFTEQARLSNLKYRFICEAKKIIIYADREKIEVALFNIVSNAFKYTPAGGEIEVALIENGDRASLTVRDTGKGISRQEGNKLFERFYQAKNNQSKSGFGIGLYLVKKFIDAHNGEVTYQSTEGKGSSFTILLNKDTDEAFEKNDEVAFAPSVDISPVTGIKENNKENELAEMALTSSATPGISALLTELREEIITERATPDAPMPKELASDRPTLLIIDDDSELLKYLVSIFGPDYKIHQADNATQGIRLAHKHLPDLIISDIIMQGLNGLDLCRTLKEDDTVSHIPVILLTGTSSHEMQLESIQSGADDYIKKPFDKDILMARVQTLLKRRTILQNYFLNEVTLGTGKFKVSAEYKSFLEKCMTIIEKHLTDDQFSIKVLASEMGMSHSNLYKKVKSVSGQTIAGFIRFIRLKKAAEMLINTENNVNETADAVGFSDAKYFRTHFSKVFGLSPSEYIKKYRKPFHNNHNLDDGFKK